MGDRFVAKAIWWGMDVATPSATSGRCFPLDGHYALAQRFAIDWEQAGGDGRLVTGDLKRPDNYRIYGGEVLAPVDGTVAASRADLADQCPGALPAGLPISEADGNFVILDIGGGAFVLLAHMQPGSVRVRAGDRAKRGDVLGKVGNTGNGQAPICTCTSWTVPIRSRRTAFPTSSKTSPSRPRTRPGRRISIAPRRPARPGADGGQPAVPTSGRPAARSGDCRLRSVTARAGTRRLGP